MNKISFRTRPSPQEIRWLPEDEVQVKDLLRDCLRGSGDSWQVALTFSGVLVKTWIVECRRLGDEQRFRVLLNPERPADVAALRAALASLGAAEGAGSDGRAAIAPPDTALAAVPGRRA